MGREAYIILEGRCAAVGNDEDGEVLLREMGPGEVFGEMAVLSNKARSASVKALTNVVLMVVSSEILSNALGLNFWMGSFVRTLVDRFREVDERLRSLEQSQLVSGRSPPRSDAARIGGQTPKHRGGEKPRGPAVSGDAKVSLA